MSRLRPYKLRFFKLIGRRRCGACGEHRAITKRPGAPAIAPPDVWRVCTECAAWIDAGCPQDEPMEASR